MHFFFLLIIINDDKKQTIICDNNNIIIFIIRYIYIEHYNFWMKYYTLCRLMVHREFDLSLPMGTPIPIKFIIDLLTKVTLVNRSMKFICL